MAAPNTTSQKTEEPAPTATPEATATPEPTPEITATPEPTEEPLQETSDSTDNSDMKFFAAIVEYAASQSYAEDKYKVVNWHLLRRRHFSIGVRLSWKCPFSVQPQMGKSYSLCKEIHTFGKKSQ